MKTTELFCSAVWCSSHRLLMVAATMGFPTVRLAAVWGAATAASLSRSSMGSRSTGRWGMRLDVTCVGSNSASMRRLAVHSGSTSGPYLTAARMSVVGNPTHPAVVASAAVTSKAMTAPAVTITPAGPGAHPQENAVVEIARTVVARRCALIGSISVVAVRANGLNPNVHRNLCLRCWRHRQPREQYCGRNQDLESAHL
jgi:hypothetical protein